MSLVAGIDSSTQSCKIVVRDARSGALVREGAARHPDGTEVHPDAWWDAFQQASRDAGGIADVDALAIGAQQHGMVALDEAGAVVRPALLWNDTRSATAADDLIEELGGGDVGRRAWSEAVGSVPVASFTVTKLRWLAEHEPGHAERVAAVALPHDWLTWRLGGARSIEDLVTDRGDASGTGYWSPAGEEYRRDLFERALGHQAVLPHVLGPNEVAGTVQGATTILGPGTGDNAAAALGLGAEPGDVVVSIGTSGVASAIGSVPSSDPSGIVAGFADASGGYLPLVCTLNAARVLDAAGAMLGIDHDELSRLARSAPAGAGGLVLVPYLEGERTPDRPDATGAIHGLRLKTATAPHLARAAVEGLLCGLADGIDALVAQGIQVERVLLIGGGARSAAVCAIAPSVFGRPVLVPPSGEYVADGAAKQAAWTLTGGTEPPDWSPRGTATHEADPVPEIRERYAEAREHTLERHREDAPRGTELTQPQLTVQE